MEKEKIYIDLSKCSEEQRKSIPQILKKANEDIYEMTENMLNSGGLIDEDGDDNYILLSKSLKNEWVAYLKSGCGEKTELTYTEFIKLFEDGEGEKKCCDNPDIQWNKVEVYIGDKQGSYKDLNFKFCYNCGETFNEAFD